MRSFYNKFQNTAIKSGAQPHGYLSASVDDDFSLLAEKYKEARDGVLLYGLKGDEIGDVMSLAKIVWRSARDQFKFMLAMNDVLVKAEKQLYKEDPLLLTQV
jgi:hypothetical protein